MATAFVVHALDACARTGSLRLARGTIQTPAFMPVGTNATVKGLYAPFLREAGFEIILANAYHLMLRPGAERIADFGGLHRFMQWEAPILTDSGGYQVMSLSQLRKITEEGVTFRSHVDGSSHYLTPERAIAVQQLLGSDIAMQLDECLHLPAPVNEIRRAMTLSLRWAERSLKVWGTPEGKAIFGIVQGGTIAELRRESAERLVEMNFPGYAIGGLAVGETQKEMLQTLEETIPFLPFEKPRYLMGVGTPEDILEAVARGVDMFDCVMPTRAGRHGLAFTRFGKMNLKNARFADDQRPLDDSLDCPASGYSRGYLHHLIRAREMLGQMLLSWHNLAYYGSLLSRARTAIAQERYEAYVLSAREGWARGLDA